MFVGANQNGSTQGYEQIYTREATDVIIQNGPLRPEYVISTGEMGTFLFSPLIFWLSGGYEVVTHARCVLMIMTCDLLA